MKRSLKRAHAIPAFTRKFALALQEFSIALRKTKPIHHSGSKGTARETALLQFFADKLPQRYKVAAGEVIDLINASSPQLDILIYDQTRDFAFTANEQIIIPSEALLASVEVKSKLSKEEIRRSVAAAQKLRKLKPFKNPLGGGDIIDPLKSRP